MRWTAAALAALTSAACLQAPPGSQPPDDQVADAASPAGPPVLPGDAAPSPMLLAAYRFDAPDALDDSSGNGHAVACVDGACPAWVSDRNDVATAALFDGVDDLLAGPPLADGPFTVMAWLRMDEDAGGGAACPVNRPYGVIGLDSYQLCMRVPSPGIGRVLFYTTDETVLLAKNVAMEVGTWHHVAIRWDGSRKTISWDGFDVASAAGKTRFDESGVRLGSDIDGEVVVGLFPGALDDVEIWQGALPEAAIAAAAGL